MGIAFIDIGLEKAGMLTIADMKKHYFEEEELDENDIDIDDIKEDEKNIEELLSPGKEIIVQVLKGPLGTKGVRLTGRISIPGKFLVFYPNQEKTAISRKIYSAAEKNRIKKILKEIVEPNTGIIVRKEKKNCTADDFRDEYKILSTAWKFLEKQIESATVPSCIFDENDIVSIIVRDIFSSEIDRLVVDDKNIYNEITSRLSEYNPELATRCELYQEESPIFDAYNIEKDIERSFQSKIFLPSGGNLVVEPTEALVAIDINTGRFIGNKKYDETINKTNLEAAKEAVRQIRLRNLTGIIIIDFIDMLDEKDKQSVYEELVKAFKKDRAKYKIYPFNPLGLIEITRKRTRSTIAQTYYDQCPHCYGAGRILTKEAVLYKINLWLKRADYFLKQKPLSIYVHPEVKEVYDKNPRVLAKISSRVQVYDDNSFSKSNYKIYLSEIKKDITSRYIP
jgi:ribonuclease G